MMGNVARLLIGLMVIVFCAGCGDDAVIEPEVEEPGDRIFIVDQTGKSWDITHAVENYGMVKANWGYGLGPQAIMPINNPEMIAPGEAGYPVDNFEDTVLGVSFDSDVRAYSILALIRNEVVNDFAGGRYISPVY